ncbi:hypothetical protein AAC387_Pa09g1080 [Persea americana]
MDMEWSESRHEHKQDSRFESSSPDAVYREEKMDDFEDGVGTVIATKDKENSQDSGKHRSKDRKKERRDHGSKDRERSKIDLLKESEENQNELRENDHIGSRERRKEEHKENHKAKIKEKNYDRDRHRDKDHGKDKDREKEHERTKDKGKDWERDKELEDRSLEREYKRGREREKNRDRERDRDREKEQERSKGRERDREKELEKDKEREKDRDREREKDRDRAKDREREREKVKDRDREREKEKYKDRDRLERDKGKEKTREKEKEKDRDRKLEKDLDKEKSRERERDKMIGKNRDQGYDKEMLRSNDGERYEKLKLDYEDTRDITMQGKEVQNGEVDNPEKLSTKDYKQRTESTADGSHPSTSELESRIVKMKEERLKKKSEGVSEVLAWVNKSRKLGEKLNADKEKALHLSKVFEEQDNVDQGESDDEEVPQHPTKDLAGVKILHGLDKVIEGGAVVLTLKDQNILADGDINEEVDMLENVEIGEQKRRDDAYKAAKKKTGTYDDKFNEDTSSQKKILPQYDDPADEGVTLDVSGHFSGEAERKLEELRRRIQGTSVSNQFQNLTTTGKISSDYYTHEEMVQFKKPKKKKSLRKREKLDLDALEAEAISAGLGVGDLGSRNEERRQSTKAEEERAEADMRTEAYQAAYAKAEEASKALRQGQTLTIQPEENENLVFGGDDEDLYKSLEKARKLALKRQDEAGASGMHVVAHLAETNNESEETQNHVSGGIVITEMEEFVSKIHLDEEINKPEADDVFKDEEVRKSFEKEMEDETGGWTEVKDTGADELPINEEKEDLVPDKIIHEPAVGKGLSGALQLLKERGTLKETIDWGGRNMDKKKSKLVGIYENDGTKEIRIERTDEFGRIMTPKEAFRMISHKFHGKGPGKMKIEKKIKKYQEELKLKQMKASDTPSESMERMREAQAQLKTPYLVLSGHVKPGQTSDPRSGFATVEKDHPGSLTPMLGDRKVEHFLGIKRKAEPSSMGPPKKQKE